MRTAKERKHVKKRAAERNKIAKTDASRKRRLSNKAKRDEIHAINPDMKVAIKDQTAYNELNEKIEVDNNKIVLTSFDDAIIEYQEIVDNIKDNNKSAIERLTDKLRRNK